MTYLSPTCLTAKDRLAPDTFGNYVTGTWSQVASMQPGYGPLYFSSAVLADGRLAVIGGEYNSSGANDACTEAETGMGAIYDPSVNAWTPLSAPSGWVSVGDASNVVLPDGRFLLADIYTTQLARLDPATLTWTTLNGAGKADRNAEEGWTLLPDGSVLTVDTLNGTQSERYLPSADSWVFAGSTVAPLATSDEMGPQVLRPNGTVFVAGPTGHASVYNVATGTWTPGPDFPVSNGEQLYNDDGPASLLPGGNVLVTAFNSQSTFFFEFDGTQLNPVPPSRDGCEALLPLPTGQVLCSGYTIYTPVGSPNSAWAPTIAVAPSVVQPGVTYGISGTQFNGLSGAVGFGDDYQGATNYPLVRITNTATGHVFYCRTHNHSTMGVATGATPVSTYFDVPPSIETGPSALVVVANGIASQPWNLVVGANAQIVSHVADGAGWKTSFLLANSDTVPASYTVNFWNQTGASYSPPLAVGATSGTIPVGGTVVIQTADSDPVNLTEGWAEVTSSQSIGGTAIFRYDTTGQEAAVPLLVSGSFKLEIPYEVGNGLALGVALANPSATQNANVTETIRDQNGNQLSSRTLQLPALSHIAFNPPGLNNLTGTGVVEYDSSANVFALGIRGANGAFTSLDAVLPQGASTKTISHIADGQGWRSTIVLVNSDTVPASYTVNFWNQTGESYSPPLAEGSATGTIPVGGSVLIRTADSDPVNLTGGWAQVTSAQSIDGTAIFRYDVTGQEAAVPLLTAGGASLEIPYQVGNGLALGVALANPSATQAASVTEIIRDQNGSQLSSRTLTLPAQSHIAFNPPGLSGLTGTGFVEYDANVNIFALGIRGNGGAFTSVPAVYK